MGVDCPLVSKATFSGPAWFGGATFSGAAMFGGATFSGAARFFGATFSGAAQILWTDFGSGAIAFHILDNGGHLHRRSIGTVTCRRNRRT